MQVRVCAMAQRLAKRMRGLGEPMPLAQQRTGGAPRRGMARIEREQAPEFRQRLLGTAELGERGGAMERGVGAAGLGRERGIRALQRVARAGEPQLDGGQC